MTEYHGKQILKIYSALDVNGNKILKVFYTDNTTEIVRGGDVYLFPIISDKHYKSLSGLYQSK